MNEKASTIKTQRSVLFALHTESVGTSSYPRSEHMSWCSFAAESLLEFSFAFFFISGRARNEEKSKTKLHRMSAEGARNRG